MTSKDAKNLQSFVALVGLVAGVVPLLRVVFGGEVGFWLSWVPGTDDTPGSWLVPSVVLVVATVVVLVVERAAEDEEGKPPLGE